MMQIEIAKGEVDELINRRHPPDARFNSDDIFRCLVELLNVKLKMIEEALAATPPACDPHEPEPQPEPPSRDWVASRTYDLDGLLNTDYLCWTGFLNVNAAWLLWNPRQAVFRTVGSVGNKSSVDGAGRFTYAQAVTFLVKNRDWRAVSAPEA